MKAITVSGPSRRISSSSAWRPLAVVLKALVVAFQPVFVARVDMGDVEQKRPELRPPPLIAAGAERADGVAVIALLARDQAAALRLALLDPVLPGELDRRLRRLRPAGDEIDLLQPRGRVGDQQVGELFRRLGGEEAGMGEGERSSWALIASITSRSPWPRHETAAPPEASR
jgi:catechol 2,3-dioxygenase-like lactoylglutathione lyase family enzyme